MVSNLFTLIRVSLLWVRKNITGVGGCLVSKLWILVILLTLLPAISLADSKITVTTNCDVPYFQVRYKFATHEHLLNKKLKLFKTIIRKYSEPDSIPKNTADSYLCLERRLFNLKAILEQLSDDIYIIGVRISTLEDDLYGLNS